MMSMRERGRKTQAVAKNAAIWENATESVRTPNLCNHWRASFRSCTARPWALCVVWGRSKRIEPNEKKSEILFPCPSLCGAFKKGCFLYCRRRWTGGSPTGSTSARTFTSWSQWRIRTTGPRSNSSGPSTRSRSSWCPLWVRVRAPRCQILRTGLMENLCVTWWEFSVLVCMEGGRGLSVQKSVCLCPFCVFVCVSVCMREYV